jgi:hypothetical protein
MDSTAQTAPLASEIITESASTGDAWIQQRKEPMRAMQSSSKTESMPNQKSSTKLLPRVTHEFDSANSPAASEIFIETASTGDAWIRHRKQPLRPPKSSPKTLPEVTHAFDSANSHTALEIFNKTASTGDAVIRQRKQHLRPQKSSTKLHQRVTHAFDSANSPCGLRNHQRKLSRWRLRNHQRNCFHG